MKRTFLFKFLLLLCMFIVGVHCVQAEETVYTKWKKTAPTSLTTGDVVVIVDLTNAVAMSNDKGTSKAPGAESVTLNDEQTRITDEEVNDNVQWKVTVTGNGYKFAKLGSETELLYGDAENGLRVGSGAANEFNMLNNFLHIVLNETNYYAGVKSSFMSSTWELLAENEGKIDDSIKKTKIAFFKKVETTAQDIDFKFLYKNYQCDVKGVDDKSWFALELETSFPGDIYNPTTFTSSDPSIASIVMDANAQEIVSTNGCHPGTATITAYFPGMVVDGVEYDDAEATCIVRVIDSSKHGQSPNDPLTVSEAIALVSGDNPPAEDVCYYINGKVSKVNSGLMAMFSEFGLDELLGDVEIDFDDFDFDMGSSGMGSMIPGFGNTGVTTYYVSDDATKDNQLKVVNGHSFAMHGGSNNCGVEFADLDDKRLTVGDDVTLFGPLVYSEDNNMFAGLFGGGGNNGEEQEEEDKRTAKVGEVNCLYSVDKLLLTHDMSMFVNTSKNLNELYTLTSTPAGNVAPATVKSGDEEIAKWVVNEAGTDSVFTALKEGSTKLTVKVKVTLTEDDPNTEDNEEKSYTMKSKYALDVINRDVKPLGKDEGNYVLVSNVNDLIEGDRLIIVGSTTNDDGEVKYHAMSTDDAMMGGGKGAKDATVENDTVTSSVDGMQIITLERDTENANFWYLNVGENENGEKLYLYASDNSEDEEEGGEGGEGDEEGGFNIEQFMTLFNGSGASLKVDTKAAAGDSCQVTINIATDGTTLTFNVPGKKNTIKLGNAMDGLMNMLGSFMNKEDEEEGGDGGDDSNPMASFNFSMPSFNCFKEDDEDATLPNLYRFVPTDHCDIVIGETHWTSVVTEYDMTLPEEEDDKLAAYIVTGVDLSGFKGHLVLQQVEKLKAGVPYLLTGVHRDGLFTLFRAEEQDTTTTDIEGNLLRVSDAETADGAYLLGSDDKGVAGMVRWSEGVTGSGHAYLPSEEVSDGRTFVPVLPQEGPVVAWCEGNKTLYFLGHQLYENMEEGTYDEQPITNYWKGDVITKTGWSVPGWKIAKDKATRVVFDEAFADVRPTSCYAWFYTFIKVDTIVGIEYLNTSEVTNMNSMFQGCDNLVSIDLRNFDVSKVNNATGMFRGCDKLTTIYCDDEWEIKTTESMFLGSPGLVGAVPYNPSKVDGKMANPFTGYFTTNKLPTVIYCRKNVNGTNMLTMFFTRTDNPPVEGGTWEGMTVNHVWRSLGLLNMGSTAPGWYDDIYENMTARYCRKVVIDESFATLKPTSFYAWFANMRWLDTIEGIENLNTSRATNMNSMFNECKALRVIDVNNFDVSKVENAERMFGWCDNLTTIYCDSSWDLTNANTELMFFNSTNLVGAVPYNQEQVDGAMANPVTGYFTYKGMPGDANNDGKVDVNDVTTVINYILSKNPSPFIYDNANVNGDDSINVMDVTLIINIILGIH